MKTKNWRDVSAQVDRRGKGYQAAKTRLERLLAEEPQGPEDDTPIFNALSEHEHQQQREEA